MEPDLGGSDQGRAANQIRLGEVMVGPVGWNGINELASLELPKDDEHLIVTVHYYSSVPSLPIRVPIGSERKPSGGWEQKWTGSKSASV